MKKIQLIYFFGLMFVSPVVAQTSTANWHSQVSIGDNPTIINADITLKPTAELLLGSHLQRGLKTNKLDVTGNYTGEAGAKVYLSIAGNTKEDGHGFIQPMAQPKLFPTGWMRGMAITWMWYVRKQKAPTRMPFISRR
ncbi:MAG: hypothetical protein LBN93_00200 [Candidatus Symbiothrix sp.]|jgi:hypothetical protein|nr:hypothetical protein [Candidatus Symbiothrix sp.]